MASTCITSVDLCAIRVSKLTTGGAPDTGAQNGYVSVAPQKLDVKVETEKGDDKTVKNGCGELMATLQTPDKIKSLSLDLVLTHLDAYLNQLMTNAALFTSGGNAIGFQFGAVGETADPVCFEGWTKAWDVDHHYVAPFTSPSAAYIHWVFPFTRWVQDKFTLENDILTVPITGVGSENPSITANGPFDDWPAAIAAEGGVTRVGGWFFDDTIPDNDSCTYVAVTSAAS